LEKDAEAPSHGDRRSKFEISGMLPFLFPAERKRERKNRRRYRKALSTENPETPEKYEKLGLFQRFRTPRKAFRKLKT